MNRTKQNQFMMLALSILVVLTVESLSSWWTYTSVHTWFLTIKKPDLQPPEWVFGPVWTILYLLMATSIWLVWKNEPSEKEMKKAYVIYGLQLFLNCVWSFLFFYMHRPDLALIDIILLWLAIAATISVFWPISRLAACLLIPYQLWVTFALYLNFEIWLLNS